MSSRSTHERAWIAFASAKATAGSNPKECAEFADILVDEWSKREFRFDESLMDGDPDIAVAVVSEEPLRVRLVKEDGDGQG